MSSFGQVKLAKVWKMLRRCAPGYRRKEQQHKWRVEVGDRVFPDLPLGKRKSRTPEVQLGVVKKMVKHLRIDPDCAYKHLPQIGKPKTDTSKKSN